MPLRATRSVRKADVDARREDDVVRFRTGDWRIGDVAVGKRRLPAEPFVDLGDGSGVERETVFAGVAQVRVEIEDFGERGGFSELVHEVLAQSDAGQVAVHCDGGAVAVVFARVVRAGEKIEGGVGIVDDVHTQAAAVDLAQVEILQRVVRVIGTDEPEDALGKVAVVLRAAKNGIGDYAAAGQIIGGVERRLVERYFVIQGFAVGIEAGGEVSGFAIAARDREAEVNAAFPSFDEAGVQALLVGGFHVEGADDGYLRERYLNPWVFRRLVY